MLLETPKSYSSVYVRPVGSEMTLQRDLRLLRSELGLDCERLYAHSHHLGYNSYDAGGDGEGVPVVRCCIINIHKVTESQIKYIKEDLKLEEIRDMKE